jgi:hypothetical protein
MVYAFHIFAQQHHCAHWTAPPDFRRAAWINGKRAPYAGGAVNRTSTLNAGLPAIARIERQRSADEESHPQQAA